jgi:hypothetical protein
MLLRFLRNRFRVDPLASFQDSRRPAHALARPHRALGPCSFARIAAASASQRGSLARNGLAV